MNVFSNKKKIIFLLCFILLIAVAFGLTKSKSKDQRQLFVLAKAEKRKMSVSVSGTGKVSVLEEVELKPKVSGEVEEVFVEKGDQVKEGELILKLKTTDFERTINDAKLGLDEATKNLENLKRKKEEAEKDLNDSYESAFNNISATFNELPRVIEILEPIFTKSTYNSDQSDLDYYRKVVSFYFNQAFPNSEFQDLFLKWKEKYQKTQKDYLFFLKKFFT